LSGENELCERRVQRNARRADPIAHPVRDVIVDPEIISPKLPSDQTLSPSACAEPLASLVGNSSDASRATARWNLPYPLASKMDLEYHAKAGIIPDALDGGH